MSGRTPLYPRLLRLRHVHPSGWQRAALGEGALAVAAVLVLADLATAWTLLVLPLAVAVVVKCHDLVAGALAGGRRAGAVGAAGPPGGPGASSEVGPGEAVAGASGPGEEQPEAPGPAGQQRTDEDDLGRAVPRRDAQDA